MQGRWPACLQPAHLQRLSSWELRVDLCGDPSTGAGPMGRTGPLGSPCCADRGVQTGGHQWHLQSGCDCASTAQPRLGASDPTVARAARSRSLSFSREWLCRRNEDVTNLCLNEEPKQDARRTGVSPATSAAPCEWTGGGHLVARALAGRASQGPERCPRLLAGRPRHTATPNAGLARSPGTTAATLALATCTEHRVASKGGHGPRRSQPPGWEPRALGLPGVPSHPEAPGVRPQH